MHVRQEQFHHFINEFNYLYQQTKTVSLPPSLSLHYLLYPTVLFPTMTFFFLPSKKVDKRAGSQQIKNKVWQIVRWEKKKKNIKTANLISFSFRKESEVQRIMSMVDSAHTDTHTFPASVLNKLTEFLWSRHAVLTGQTRYTHTTHSKWKQETVGHRRWYMSMDRFIISPFLQTHTHTHTYSRTHTGYSVLPSNTTTP